MVRSCDVVAQLRWQRASSNVRSADESARLRLRQVLQCEAHVAQFGLANAARQSKARQKRVLFCAQSREWMRGCFRFAKPSNRCFACSAALLEGTLFRKENKLLRTSSFMFYCSYFSLCSRTFSTFPHLCSSPLCCFSQHCVASYFF